MPYSADKRLDELTAHATVTANDLIPVQDEGAGDLLRSPASALATFVLAQTTFTDHSARHESGGADVISIAGLAGTPTELTNHLNDTSAAHAASAISFSPTGTIAATDVQAAIAEVASEASGLTNPLAAGTVGANALQVVQAGTGLWQPATNHLGIAANGIEAARFETLASGTQYLVVVPGTAAGNLKIKSAGTGSDTRSMWFEAPGGGFVFFNTSTELLEMNTTSIRPLRLIEGNSGNRPFLDYTADPTATVPSVGPGHGDRNTGIGAAGADQLSLIAGGVEGIRVEATKATFAGRILGKQGADVASGNDITLGNGNYFDITGTTQINTIASTGWTAGSLVTLQFDGSVTVKHNTAGTGAVLLLAGAADFSATANDTLTLMFDGTNFREVARTVI